MAARMRLVNRSMLQGVENAKRSSLEYAPSAMEDTRCPTQRLSQTQEGRLYTLPYLTYRNDFAMMQPLIRCSRPGEYISRTTVGVDDMDRRTQAQMARLGGTPLRSSVLFSKPMRKPKTTTIYEDTVALDCPSEIWNMDRTYQRPAKDSRRRTIWVPPDDTTVLTIHPGMHTGTLHDETMALARLSISGDKSVYAEPTRTPTLHGSARRPPLSAVRPPSANRIFGDIPGMPTGKENIVPQVKQVDTVFDDLTQSMALDLKSPVPPQSVMSPGQLSEDLLNLEDLSLVIFSAKTPLPSFRERLQRIAEPLGDGEILEWNDNQEALMAELVNEVLAHGHGHEGVLNGRMDATALMAVYQQPCFLKPQRVLTTSVTTGVLSLPAASEVPRLQEDVGMRQKFLELWVDTYDQSLLWTAANAVSGTRRLVPLSSLTDEAHGRKNIVSLLATTLLPVARLDNAKPNAYRRLRLAAWQSTVVRSLMIISLLDHICTAGIWKGCLFTATSKIKSSIAMLHAVAGLALPFVGDITRTLGYMGDRVTQQQDPLDEYRYHVTNLPTDMRDGVLLARVLEILKEDTTTITAGAARPLSTSLKYPCHSRAQKLGNVQRSLQTLNAVPSISEGITATDVVDGHREKTLSLLWSIVRHWGLSGVPIDEIGEDRW